MLVNQFKILWMSCKYFITFKKSANVKHFFWSMLLMIEEVGMPELMEEILEDCIDLVNFFIHFSYFYIFVILITFSFFDFFKHFTLALESSLIRKLSQEGFFRHQFIKKLPEEFCTRIKNQHLIFSALFYLASWDITTAVKKSGTKFVCHFDAGLTHFNPVLNFI